MDGRANGWIDMGVVSLKFLPLALDYDCIMSVCADVHVLCGIRE